MGLLKKFNAQANRVLCVAMVVCFVCMVVLIFLQVICRYALGDALSWSEELAGYFFHWATFLGASVAFYEHTHISVSYFVERVPNIRARAAIFCVADLCCLWFLGMYIYEGFNVCRMVFDFGETASSMTWLPMGYIQLAIPLASVFMALNVLAYFIRHARVLFSGADDQAQTEGA